MSAPGSTHLTGQNLRVIEAHHVSDRDWSAHYASVARRLGRSPGPIIKIKKQVIWDDRYLPVDLVDDVSESVAVETAAPAPAPRFSELAPEPAFNWKLVDVRKVVELLRPPAIGLQAAQCRQIVRQIAAIYEVRAADIYGPCHHPHFVRPRQLAMYAIFKFAKWSSSRIGKFFGGRDHSTALYACRMIEVEIFKNAAWVSEASARYNAGEAPRSIGRDFAVLPSTIRFLADPVFRDARRLKERERNRAKRALLGKPGRLA